MGRTLITILALVALSRAATLPKTGTCSRQCTESTKFGYETGKTYTYDYTSKVSTSINGASEDKSEINMAAKVHIEIQSKCDFILQVSDVVLTETDPKAPKSTRNADDTQKFKQSLEKHSLMFSFQDGRVEDICPSDDEQTWALNIKRAIVSAFQNSMDDFSQEKKTQETDVTGSCGVSYSVESNGWYSMTIKKTKDTLGCVDRHGYRTALQGTPYRVPSEIQSLPLVKSTHECQQGISKSGILQSSSCEEQHVLRPFSRDSSGAVTDTRQTLKYVSESQTKLPPVSVSRKTSLAFEHTIDTTSSDGAQSDVINKLKEICQSSKDHVQVSTASQFSGLVKLMKGLDTNAMDKVHKAIHSGKVCADNKNVEKYFLDAVPMVGTQASMRMMTNLINDNEVTGPEADMWLTSLAFIQKPTREILMELKPLLTNTKNGQAMLAVSSLVNTYCKTSPCANDIDMINLVSSLEDKIAVGCYVDETNVNIIIRTLRALGNAGFASTVSTVKSCLTKMENPIEVRLAAAQAFRRMPCDDNDNGLLSVYTNRDEDSELRIAAYLSLMKCPSKSLLKHVQTTLESEEVNQVGSFVWTHLKNLMESPNPLKQSIKAILTNDILKREFNLEKLKYSRNYDASFFLEKINTGATIDSNLIWSSKSFLPRSAMTNVTVDLFGQSVNLFELGGRVEGLEYFLESYFGPEGYFGKKKETKTQNVKGISNKVMDSLNQQYGKTMADLRGSMYLRVFGNELQYINSDDIKSLVEGKNFNILDFIINLAKEQDYSMTQNVMFLDTSVVVPTMTGFPLNISLDGSATVHLQASGKMDLRQLRSNPRTISIDGKIKPSAAVQVTALMSVDAFVTNAGMKMVSTMNSASALEGHVELKGGQLFSAEWKTPEAKTEFLEARTSFFSVHRDEIREQKMITDNRQTKKVCTGDRLAQLSGLEMCGEISYPNASLKADAPYFPLTGPLAAGITLSKRDSHKSYIMEYKLAQTKNLVHAGIEFNTPGSKIDRQMKLGFDMNMNKHIVDMVMLSPWKKATFNGAIRTEERQLNGKLIIDQSEYSVNGALTQNRKSSTWTYKPTLEIVVPGRENIKLDGTIKNEAGKTFDAAVSVNGLSKDAITMQLSMLNKKVIRSVKGGISFSKKEEYSFETRLQTLQTKKSLRYTPFVSIKALSKEQMGLGGSIEIKYKQAVKVDLTVTGLTKSPMKYLVQVRDTGNAKQTRLQSNINIQSPVFTTKGRSNFILRPSAVITRTNIDYIIPRVARDKITMNSKVNWRITKKATTLKGNGVLSFKKMSHLNLNLGVNYLSNTKVSKSDVEVKYGANNKNLDKMISFSSVVKHQLAWRASDVSLNAKLTHPESGIDVKVKGSHSHNKKSIDTTLSINSGKTDSIDISVFLKDKSKKLSSIAGGVSMTVNQRKLSLSNVFNQQNKQKYENDFTAIIGKTKASVKSAAKVTSAKEFEISNDISLPNMKTFTVAGQLSSAPRDFRVGVQLGKEFDMTFTSQYKPNTMIKVGGNIRVEETRLMADIEAEKSHPKYFGKVDLKWDADRNPSRRLKIVGDFMNKDAKEVSAKIEITNPIKDINTQYSHVLGKESKGHFDVSVEGKPRFVIDLTHSDDNNKQQGEARIQTTTEIGSLKYSRVNSDKKYSNDVELSWSNSKKVTASLALDQPISLRNVKGTVTLTTPFTGYESSTLEINHSFNNKLATSLMAQLNKDKVQLSVDATNNGVKDISGTISLKTSYPGLKSSSLTVTNVLSDDKVQNAVEIDINGKKFQYEGLENHKFANDGFKTNGKVAFIFGKDTIGTKWDHSHSGGHIASKWTTDIKGKQYTIDLSGRQALTFIQGGMSVNLQLKSPFTEDIQLRIDHQHQPSLVDSSVAALIGAKPLMSGKMIYKREVGTVNFKTSLNAFEMTNEVSVITDYKTYPLTGQISMTSNGKTIDMTGSYDNQHVNQNAKLKITTPFSEPIVLTADKNNDREMMVASSLQYGNKQIIAVETRRRWDNVKSFTTSVVSSFKPIDKAGVSYKQQNEQVSAFIEVNRMKLSSEWNTAAGLTGKMRIDTPFPELPYSQIVFTSAPGMASSELNIEYMPRKNIILKSHFMSRQNVAEGGLDIATPFSMARAMSGSFRLVNKKNEMNSEVSYTCPTGDKYTAELGFNTHPIRKIKLNLGKNNKKINFDGSLDLNSGYPHGNMKLATPFNEDILVEVKQRQVDGDIVTAGSLVFSSGRKISVENKFRMDNGFVFTTSVATPFESLRTINSVLEAKGDRRSFSFTGSMESEPITKKFLVSGIFNMYGGIDGNLRVETPFDILPYSQITVTSQRKGDLTTTLANIEYMPGKFITAESKHRINTNDIEISTEIKTPFRSMRHASGSIRHKFDETTGLTSHCSIEYPKGKQYSADITFNKVGKIMGSATVNSPFNDPISLSFNHQGKYPSIESHGELKYQGNQKHVFDFTLDNKAKNFKGAVSYKCPSLDKISFEISHKGNFKQFNTEVKTQFKKGEPHEVKVSFKNLAKMQGNVIVQSAYMDDFKASFHHTGSLKNLKSHAEYVYGKMKPASVDLALITGKRVKGIVKLSSPFFNDITLNLLHKGQPNNFRNKINLIFSKKEKISTDLNFRLAKVMKATFIFASPFKGWKKVVANVKHEGSWNNFKCDASVKRGKELIKANMKTSLGSSISWSTSIETPFNGWKKVDAAISHEGKLTNFKTHAELSRGKQYIISGDIKFIIKPTVDILVAAQTPYPGYKNVKASFVHDITDKKVKTNAELAYFKKDAIRVDFLVDRPTQSVDLVVTTPFKDYENIRCSSSHTGLASVFTTKMDCSLNKDKYTGELSFDTINQLSVAAKVSTPSKMYPVTEVSLVHSGTINNFHSRANVVFNKRKSFADLAFNAIGSVEGKLTIMTPIFETLEANFLHEDAGKMKTSLNIDLDKKPLISFDSIIGQKRSSFGTASLKVRSFPKIQGTYDCKGDMFNNKASIQIFYGKDKFSLETEMESNADLNGKIVIVTPFKVAETMYLTYSNSRTNKKVNGKVEVGINEQKGEMDINYSVEEDMIKASASIKTPFNNFNHVEVSTRFAGVSNNFDSHAKITFNGKVAEIDLMSIIKDRVDVRATIKNPFTKDLNFKVSHDGAADNFKSDVEAGYGYKKITGQITTDLTNGIQIDATIKSPFSENIIFATSSNNDFVNFRSLTQLTYNGVRQHELEITTSALASEYSLKSSAEAVYNGKRVSGKFELVGERAKLTSYAEVNCANKKSSIEIGFDATNNINGHIELKTPYTEDASILIKHAGPVHNFNSEFKMSYGRRSYDTVASFSHDGTLRNFKTYGDLAVNGQKTIISVTFDSIDYLEGKASLKTPFSEEMIFHFSHENTMTSFKDCLKITYSGKLQHDASLRFVYDGSLRKFNAETSLSYNSKKASTSFTFDTTDYIEGKLTVKTPVSDDVIVHFSHEGQLQKFKSCLKITYNGKLQHDASFIYMNEGSLNKFNTETSLSYNSKKASASFTFDTTDYIEGKLTVKTPVSDDVIVHFSHEGHLQKFKSCLKITYSGKLQHDGSFIFMHDGDLKKFNTETSLSYNSKKASASFTFDTTDYIEGKLTVKTPISDDVIVHFSHEGHLRRFKSCLKVTYSGKLQHDISFVFKAIGFQVFDGETSLKYNDKNAVIKVTFDGANDLKEGKVTVKTPVMDDIIIAFSTEGSLKSSKTCLKVTYSGKLQHDISVRFGFDGSIIKSSTMGSIDYNNKRCSFSLSIDSIDKTTVEFTLKTPFYEDVVVSARHIYNNLNINSGMKIMYGAAVKHDVMLKLVTRGSIRRFDTDLKVNYNEKFVSTAISFDTKSTVSGKIDVKSSWTKDLMASLTTVGTPMAFSLNIVTTYGTTSHTGSVSLNLKKNPKSIKSDVEVDFNGQKAVAVLSVDFTSGLISKVEIVTPWTNDISCEVQYRGQPTAFTTSLKTTYGQKSYNFGSKFSLLTTGSKFGIQSEATFNNNKVTFVADLTVDDKYTAKLYFSSPFTYDFDSVATFQLNRNTFLISTSMQTGGSTLVDSKLSITRKDADFQQSVNLHAEYNGQEVSSDASVVMYDMVDAKITIVTPFQGFEEIVGGVQYDFTDKTITFTANGRLGSKDIIISSSIEKTLPFNANINVKTPFSGFSDSSFRLKFNDNPTNFRLTSNVEVENQMMYDLTFEHLGSSRQVQGSVVLKTAYVEDISLKYDIEGSLQKFTSSLSASVGGSNFIKSNTAFDFSKSNLLTARSSVSVSYTGIEKSAEIELSGARSFTDLNGFFKARFGNSEIKMESTLKLQPFEAVMKLDTPFESARSTMISIKYAMKANMISNSVIISFSPEKKYETNLNMMIQRFSKASIKAEVKTPIKGHELMRFIYRHDVDIAATIFTSYECSTGIQVVGDVKLTPYSYNVELNTPFRFAKLISANGKIEKQNNIFNLETSFKLDKKSLSFKSLIDLESSPMTAGITLSTPFRGLESSHLKLSCTGDKNDLRSTFELKTPLFKPVNSEMHLRYKSFVNMEATAVLSTGFKYLERIRASMVNTKQGNSYQSHIETSWNKDSTISIDAACDVSNELRHSLVITTPFKTFRMAKLDIGRKSSENNKMVSVFLEHNGYKLIDMDAAYTKEEHRTLSLITRHPRPMNFRVGGNKEPGKVNTDISLNWNTERTDSNINMEAYFTHSDDKCSMDLRLSHPKKNVALKGALEMNNKKEFATFDVTLDNNDIFGYTYDCEHSDSDRATSIKLRFPSRSILFSNGIQQRLGSKMSTTSFFWDADKDQSKKVTVRGELTPDEEGVEANIILEMPSIGQDVQLDSHVKVNKGGVLFDGKTALKYSMDPSKTLLLTTKIEDKSTGSETNYNLNVGIKHPYTTVDVEMDSSLQSSQFRSVGSVGVRYQTAERQTKNMGLVAEIDRLKKTLRMELDSPIKSINMKGHIQTTAPYKVSIQNVYDKVKPMNAEITLDPSDVSIDANINYDIDNPQNVLHLNTKFGNTKGLTAEIYRNVDQVKTVDTIVNLRLKTSRILHTSVTWNPEILTNIKVAGMNRIRNYGDGINTALETVFRSLDQEVTRKQAMIVSSIKDDLKPYIVFLNDRISDIEQMKANNDYYLNDISSHFVTTQTMIRNRVQTIMTEMSKWSESIDMAEYNIYLTELTELVKLMERYSLQYYAEVIDFVQSQSSKLSTSIEGVYNLYGKPITESVSLLTGNRLMNTIKSNLPTIPVNELANQYNSVIYNARESINAGLIKVMPTPVYNAASSAYKYWELEENIQSVFAKVVELIKKDIQEDFDSLRDLIVDLKKTKVTVYDPKKGHFEMDIYLPLEMQSLTQVRRFINPLESIRSLIPQRSPLPSWDDLWSHAVLPNFGAQAYIQGNHFTTFDGQKFDFNGRCSYLLSRDFGQDKFSIVLSYLARQNKKLIVLSKTQNVQVSPNGIVKVDGSQTKLPYVSDELRISQVGDEVFVDGQGFSIVNDVKKQSYQVNVSHWFHGRTAGLLGIHDNERFNDMTTSGRHITSDANELANSWNVEEKCR